MNNFVALQLTTVAVKPVKQLLILALRAYYSKINPVTTILLLVFLRHAKQEYSMWRKIGGRSVVNFRL